MELFVSLTMAAAAGLFIGGILWIVGAELQKRLYQTEAHNRKTEAARLLQLRADLVRTARRAV